MAAESQSNPSVLKALLWAAIAFFAWNWIAMTFIWPPSEDAPKEDGPTVVQQTPSPAGDSVASSDPTSATPIQENGLHVAVGDAETVMIGAVGESEGGAHRILAEVSTIGAGIVRAELVDHRASVAKDAPNYPMLSPVEMPDGTELRSYTTRSMVVHLADIQMELKLADVPWRLVSRDQDSATMVADVLNGSQPVLRLSKKFHIPEQPMAEKRYDMLLDLTVENLSDKNASVIITQSGAVGVRREDPRMDDRGLFVASKEAGYPNVGSEYQSSSDAADAMFEVEDGLVPLWMAVANKYFVAFLAPLRADGQPGPDWVTEIRRVPRILESDANHHVLELITKPLLVPPGGERSLDMLSYLGPKSRKVFTKQEQYAALEFGEQVLESYGMGPCSFMAFPSLTRFMIWLLNNIRAVVFNYGVAIIILVLIVRTILHPITKRGQVQMMRVQQSMGTLQPKMEELKRRYPNDKARQSQEMMKIYQEAGVNPMTGMMSGCLPMFLQMPIWIALYTSLNYNVDMRHQPFILWISDLTAPDNLIPFGQTYNVPLLGPTSGFNLLPIFVCLSMFFQQKLMPKPAPPPGQSDEQAAQAQQMQKMMPYMSLVMGVIFYNMPSGLNLYIAASSFFGMIEQKRIRAHIEELKQQGPDEKPAKKKNGDKPRKPGWFEKLQKAAEEAQKQQHKGGKNKKR